MRESRKTSTVFTQVFGFVHTGSTGCPWIDDAFLAYVHLVSSDRYVYGPVIGYMEFTDGTTYDVVDTDKGLYAYPQAA